MELKQIINQHLGVGLNHIALRLLNEVQDQTSLEYDRGCPSTNGILDREIEKQTDDFKTALIEQIRAIESRAFQVTPSAEEKIWEVQGQALVELTEEDPAHWVVSILLRPGKAEYVEHHGRKFVKK